MATRVPYYAGPDFGDQMVGEARPCPVRGIEVVQAVQDLSNSVVLIANKKTIARVYPGVPEGGGPMVLSGEIAWRRASGGEAYVPPIRPVRFDPAAHPDVEEQRRDPAASLNFELPAEAIAAGPLQLRVSRIFGLSEGEYDPAGTSSATVTFEGAPPLRVRAIGLRYRHRGTGATHSPDAVHFSYMRSFLQRAYPVAEVIWSQQVVEADFQAPFGGASSDLANAQLAALRSREVSAGVDPRTHYYGLVSDRGGFMRGKAFDIPGDARPDTVAVGPVGVPQQGFGGDIDQSYADWYGAHELAHTFGRYHPGFPRYDPSTGYGQDNSDPTFPYLHGLISNVEPSFLGLDVGDPGLALSMAALSGRDCHDVMTYEDRQWLSAYTYEAILQRLRAEEQLVP